MTKPMSETAFTPPIDPDSDESAIYRVRIVALTAPLSDSLAADLLRVCDIAERALTKAGQ